MSYIANYYKIRGGVKIMNAKNHKHYPVEQPEFEVKKKYVYRFFKRAFDIFFSFFLIILALLPMLIIAICIKCDTKGPIIYKSIRFTTNGRPFVFYKFRTMFDGAEKEHDSLMYDENGNLTGGLRIKIHEDKRITPFGVRLRKSSLDELPQLFNILKGDMTFVGPRPCIESEIALYSQHEQQRLLVKQGLTCIWQCSGRSNVSFEEQVEMDIEYIKKRSLWFDFKLLLKTIPAVLSKKGAY